MDAYHEKIVDLSYLINFTKGDKEKVNKYIGMFRSMAPEMLAAMKGHLAQQQYTELKQTAHALKPQLKYMGIIRSIETIAQIETIAGELKDLHSLNNLVDVLERYIIEALAELNDL